MSQYQIYYDNAVKAARGMVSISAEATSQVLLAVADEAVLQTGLLLAENQKDLDRMDVNDPKYDRLQLTAERIKDIAQDIRNVAGLNSVLNKVILEKEMPNGLQISKITVPLGVVGVIYESRPNVTFDVFALCFKTGNVSVLKGSGDAEYSNKAIIGIIHRVLQKHGIDINAATLLPPERAATDALLNAVGFVDVLIPRGSQSLINHVRTNSKIPVIETGAGIVHTYFDKDGSVNEAAPIIYNAKTRRPSVCNSLDCLLVDVSRLADLPGLVQLLAGKEVEIYADEPAYKSLFSHYPGTLLHKALPEHFGMEFLSLKMAVKTVGGLPEALDHIAEYSSKHSEAIITENMATAEKFLNEVDAAAVYVNASTAFTDGGQFGLGAEIGISTQKLHARGPMGLEELTSYKWVIRGEGQVR